jgi:hypothetical protein
MRPSLNLESMSDSSPVESIMANLCASAREWFEVLPGGAWRQDRLTNADASTGMPTSLPAGVVARSVIPIFAAGTYVCAWDGAATVAVELFGGGSASGSSMPEYLAADPTGPTAPSGGRFTFTHDGNSRQAWLSISDIGVGDPPSNLRVCRIEDEAGWQGLSSEFAARMAILRPQCVRLLDIMEPNSTRDTLETWAQRRPNGWWTQSNVALDVFTVPAASWSGTAPALGDTITWSGGSGAWVRVGSPVAGVLGHVKLSGAHATSGVVTCTRTGATATLTAAMAPWQPRIVGPSELWLRDFAAAMIQFGLTHLWLTTYYGAVDDWHTQLATAFEADARLDGLKVVPEYGNESWNTIGSYSVGYTYCNDQGTALGMPGPNAWEKGGQYYAHRQRQIHDLWRAVYAGRETEIVRLFAGQNAQGEYWFTWRTVINPDSDGAFPAWPNESLPIDAWATGPYIGHVDEAPYNTAAWWESASDQAILDYLVNDQLPKHVTSAPTGTPPYRSGGFRSHSVFADERGCELWAYETNFHMYQLSGAQGPAMTARVTLWMRTAYCAAAFLALLEALADYATPTGCVAVYNSARQWGASGWWGLIENPYDGTANDVRWQVLVTFGSGETTEITFSEADIYFLVRAANWQIEGTQSFDARAQRATMSIAVNSPSTEIIAPTVLVVKADTIAAISVGVAGASWEIDGDTDAKVDGIVIAVMAVSEAKVEVVPPVSDVVEATAEATPISFAVAAATWAIDIVDATAQVATMTVSVPAVQVEVVPPGGGGGNIGRSWVLMRIANAPKATGVELPRGSLLAWEAAGPAAIAVGPLRAGRKFAGLAAAHAESYELVASISRAGVIDVELEDVPEERETVIVAIDDQRLYSEKGASAAGLPYTIIGKGFYRGDGICSVVYYAEGHH